MPESSILPNCKFYADRATGEQYHLQKKGKILEVGIAQGAHAASLIKNLNPSTFHGVDISLENLSDENKAVFHEHGSKGNIVMLRQFDSIRFLEEKIESNETYNSIYIDASHWHEFVHREIELSSRLVDIGGHIVLNDYCAWFVRSMEPCGVIKATNNFLHRNKNWKVEYFAVNDCDICIRRVG